MAARGKPDWPAIYTQYRLGILSIRLIAAIHGVSEGAIRKKAKRHGWKRDMADAVHLRTWAILVHHDVQEARKRGLFG